MNLIHKYLKSLLNITSKTGCHLFLVGGTVRDHLLGNECADFDFTAKNVKDLARRFSRETQSTCVPLDKTPGRETFRVIFGNNFNFDFTELQGSCIEEDLGQRDFTINAMAVPLKDFIAGKESLIDPHGGQSDLKDNIIRVVPGPVFKADPLRMLRAFRFAAALQFAIEHRTLEEISKTHTQISGTAPERIYYELILFLNAPRVFDLLKQMDKTGLLECIFPSGNELGQTAVEPENTWPPSLHAFKILEDYLYTPETLPLMKEAGALITGRSCALLKLACLLHGLDAPDQESKTVSALKELRASNADIEFISQSIQCQREATATGLDFAQDPVNESRLYRFVKEYGDELIPGLILACAVSSSRPEDKKKFIGTAHRMSEFYFHRYLPAMKNAALLNGNDLIHQFKLSPSPLFRVILDCVEEGRVLGTITSRKEAEQTARNIIDTQ